MSQARFPFTHRFLRSIIRGLLRLLCRLNVEGVEHVPTEGPFMLVSNHLHWLDIPLLWVTFPCRVTVFAARKWGRRPVIGWLLRTLGNAIFVFRGEVDRQALRQALAVLKDGGILALAPEGTRSKTGALQRGKDGVAYMAARTGVPLVPVVAYGQEKIFSSLRRGCRAEVHVIFGPPFQLPGTPGRVNREQLHAFTEQIMLRLAAMLPPAYRGVYATAVQEESRTLPNLP